MSKGRVSKDQILGILRRHQGGEKVADLAHENGVSVATLYAWRSKYGRLDPSEAQRLKQLEEENRVLKHLVADLSLDREVLRSLLAKNGWSTQSQRS